MRKFILWSLFVVLVAVVAYVLFGNPGSVPAPSSTAVEEPTDEPAFAESAPTETGRVTTSVTAPPENQMGPVDVTIMLDGTVVKTLPFEAIVDAKVFKETARSVYVGIYPSELGGYINFGGPYQLYQVSLENKSMKQIRASYGEQPLGFFTDISSDERLVAFFDYNKDSTAMRLHVRPLYNGDHDQQVFLVPAPYRSAGDAFFSPDGSKVAFTGTCGNPDAECGAIYIVNLTTETMEIVPGSERTGEFVRATGWVNNDEVKF